VRALHVRKVYQSLVAWKASERLLQRRSRFLSVRRPAVPHFTASAPANAPTHRISEHGLVGVKVTSSRAHARRRRRACGTQAVAERIPWGGRCGVTGAG
jgi:hypothetical protein